MPNQTKASVLKRIKVKSAIIPKLISFNENSFNLKKKNT